MRSLWACLAVASSTGLWATAPGHAEPLPKEACDAVAVEHAKLTAEGLPELLKKGPDWVRTNLGEPRVHDVARYIQLQEQMLFRCGYDKARALPGADGDDSGDQKTDQNSASATPPPLPERKPPVPAAFKPQTQPTPVNASPKAAPPARSRPKPRRQQKADDAYRPPPRAAVPQ